MKVKWQGKEYKWLFSAAKVNDNNRSGLHLSARECINNVYPLDVVLEEILIPGIRLRADFFLPKRGIMIEVQGEQHYKHISFFHKNSLDFNIAKRNDEKKRDFCDENNIILLEFSYKDNHGKWEEQLRNAFG